MQQVKNDPSKGLVLKTVTWMDEKKNKQGKKEDAASKEFSCSVVDKSLVETLVKAGRLN